MLPAVLSLNTVLIASAAALVVGLATGGYAAHSWYAPRLDLALEQKRSLGDRVAEQNAAVDALQREAALREASAKEAMLRAQDLSNQHAKLAQQLLTRQKPAGVSECQAVEALFRERLGR